jgi:hypothetical protein
MLAAPKVSKDAKNTLKKHAMKRERIKTDPLSRKEFKHMKQDALMKKGIDVKHPDKKVKTPKTSVSNKSSKGKKSRKSVAPEKTKIKRLKKKFKRKDVNE